MRLSTAAFVLALLPGFVRADGNVPPAGPAPSPHLAAAERLYQRADLEAALAELKQAEIASRDNEDETAQILIYQGLIFAETGKSIEAQDMFKRALAMRPWAEVPADTSPRLAKIFGDARKSVWGSGGSIKPPPQRRSAVPALSSTPPPKAVAAQAIPATSTGASAEAIPATITVAPSEAQPPK